MMSPSHYDSTATAPMASSGQKRSHSTSEFTIKTAHQGPENLRYDHKPEEMESLTSDILALGK